MKRREPRLEPELQALLAPGKISRRAPPEVRARALARARAIVAAGGRIPSATVLEFPTPAVLIARRRVPVWVTLAASVAVAAMGTIALRAQTTHAPLMVASPTAQPPLVVRDEQLETASADPPQPAAQPAATPAPAHTARTSGDEPSLSAELDLLSRAQGAYTRGDFARALTLIAEHARRFPNGHLAEEREALRVRSLTRSGHTDESRRAAAAFTQRFPRSVLSAQVEGSPSPK